MLDFDKMSIADLKSALDFVRENIKDAEQKADKEGLSFDVLKKQEFYEQDKNMENCLYNALVNSMLDLSKQKG